MKTQSSVLIHSPEDTRGLRMAIYERITEFAGKKVADSGQTPSLTPGLIFRISIDWDASQAGKLWTDRLADFLADPASSQVTGIVVGHGRKWGSSITRSG